MKRLRAGLRRLCEQTFKHRFRDTVNPICNYWGRYRHFITFFNVQTIYRKEWLSWIQSSVLFPIFKIWIMPAKWNPFAWKELTGTKRFDVQLSWWFLDIMTLTLILFLKFKFLSVFLFCFYYYYYLLIIFRLFFVFHTLFPGMSHINVHPVQLIMTFGQNRVTTID